MRDAKLKNRVAEQVFFLRASVWAIEIRAPCVCPGGLHPEVMSHNQRVARHPSLLGVRATCVKVSKSVGCPVPSRHSGRSALCKNSSLLRSCSQRAEAEAVSGNCSFAGGLVDSVFVDEFQSQTFWPTTCDARICNSRTVLPDRHTSCRPAGVEPYSRRYLL